MLPNRHIVANQYKSQTHKDLFKLHKLDATAHVFSEPIGVDPAFRKQSRALNRIFEKINTNVNETANTFQISMNFASDSWTIKSSSFQFINTEFLKVLGLLH